MGPTPVEITLRSNAEEEEIAILDNVDDISSTDAMLGCGDDNPY